MVIPAEVTSCMWNRARHFKVKFLSYYIRRSTMKKLFTVILSAALLMTSTFSIFAQDSAEVKDKTLEISIDQIPDMLNKGNPELKLMDEKMVILKKQYDNANARSGILDRVYASDPKVIDNWKDILLTPKKYEYDINNLKYDREDRFNALKLETERQYYDAQVTANEIENVKTEISNTEVKIKNAKLKLSLELIKESDVEPLYLQQMQMKSQLNSSERELENTLLDIKKSLGIDTGTVLKLKPADRELKYLDDKNIDDKIKKSAEGSYELKRKSQELDLAKIEYGIYERFDSESQEEKDLKITVKGKELDLKDTVTNEEVSLWTSYYNLKNLEDNIAVEKLSQRIAQIDLDIAKAKQGEGFITSADYTDSVLALHKQNTRVQKAINEYMAAAERFSYKIGKQIEQ